MGASRAEAEAVGAGDRDASVIDAPHPRDDVPVVEADDELRAHLHAAPDALDDAHDVRRTVARRHEVVDAHGAVVVLPRRLEDEGVTAVSTRRRAAGRRREQPAAVLGVTEQRGEAGAGVEAGEAEPVDRTAAFDEGGGLQVADHRVVLYESHRHRLRAARSKTDSYSVAASSSRVRAKRSRMSASASFSASTTSM